MRISNRYASAVHSSNLKNDVEFTMSDPDVLGAMGIADRRLTEGLDHEGNQTMSKHPLAVPLERLFAGDSSSAADIIRILAEIVRGKARAERIRMTPVQASDLARVALGWYRDSACKVCGGHGFKIIPGTKTLGNSKCKACSGTGKVQLEDEFRIEQRALLRWVLAQLEREAGQAGPAAMRALAPTLDLG